MPEDVVLKIITKKARTITDSRLLISMIICLQNNTAFFYQILNHINYDLYEAK